MTWKIEIVRAFFVAFGAMQTISNLTYLLKKNGVDLAKKQHRELPDNITITQIKTKTVCMLLFGILFLATGLFSYFTRTFYEYSFIIGSAVFMIYTLIESIYYRYWKTFGAFILSTIVLLIVVFS